MPVMLQSISLLSLGASLRIFFFFFFPIEFEQNHKWTGCRLVIFHHPTCNKGAHPLCSYGVRSQSTEHQLLAFLNLSTRKAAGEDHALGTSVGFHMYSTLSSTCAFSSTLLGTAQTRHFLRGLALHLSKNTLTIHIRWTASVHALQCGSIVNGPFSRVNQVP